MVGLTVTDMDRAMDFYRRLGLDLPDAAAGASHVEVKMRGEYTLFLDNRPIRSDQGERSELEGYDVLLEFYLPSRAMVDAKYRELTQAGYASYRAPFEVPRIGMYFALVSDPDGHTILLSGDLADAAPAG
jgi:predicted enzyme related to lactoylglutathione lyase